MLFAISIGVSLVIGIYFYLTWNYEYWKTRGVLYPKPKIFFGNFSESGKRKCHAADDFTRIYDEYKNRANFIGVFQMRSPRIFVLEPELCKEILVKNFKNFRDNEFSQMLDIKHDPLLSRNPFLSRGDEWKERRAEISPAFTSNRMKSLFPLIKNVSQRFSKYIGESLNEAVEAKDLATKFTTEAVASCIFGIEANSFTEGESELRQMSKKFFKPSGLTIFKFIVAAVIPPLKSLLKIQFIPNDVHNFFVNLTEQAVSYRVKNQVSREDHLDYLMTLQKKKGLSSTEITAHSITFFSDGLETSSIAIAYAFYELANNPEVQEKLRKEINEFSSKSEGITFDVLNEMPYLDQVLNETLRLHPPFHAISKECNEAIEIEYLKGKSVLIEKGINVYIPLYQMQRDAEYYPNPLEFIPERFDEEHGGVKAYRDKGVFLTFGDGPRFCLGMKFALMQSKAAIVEVVKNFKLSVNEKTEKTLVNDPNEFMNFKIGGLWLDFKPVKMFSL